MSRTKITEEGQLCWHCQTPVVKRVPKSKPRGNRAYYFEYYLRCPNKNCRAMYMVESAKRFWSESEEKTLL